MKHLILTTSLVLSLSFGAAFAQQTTDPQTAPPAGNGSYHHHHHAPNPQQQAAFLTQKLNLTAAQSQAVEPILATRDQQMQALWQNQQLAPEDRHQQMRTINQQAEQSMASVLNPEQMTELKAMRHHGHHHHGQDGDQGQAPAA